MSLVRKRPACLANVPRSLRYALATLLWTIVQNEAFPLELTEKADAFELAWASESLTTTAPFLHQDFQVQASHDLRTWTNHAALIPGGLLGAPSIPLSALLPKGNNHEFYRLLYRLNVP